MVAGHGVDAVGPGEEGEHHHIGGAVEHTDGAEQRRHQRVAHKAAVGEHGAEQQQAPAVGVLLPDQKTGEDDERGVEQQRHAQHDGKFVEQLTLQRALERHQHHAGGDDVHHQIAHAQGATVIDELDLAQRIAHGHQQVQRDDLTAYRQKGSDHREGASFIKMEGCGILPQS